MKLPYLLEILGCNEEAVNEEVNYFNEENAMNETSVNEAVNEEILDETDAETEANKFKKRKKSKYNIGNF